MRMAHLSAEQLSSWRNSKQLGFNVSFRTDHGIEWMLLDKANVINDCPDWIECKDIEYTSVNGIQKNSAKTKRQIQKEMQRQTEYEDETESESEVIPAASISCWVFVLVILYLDQIHLRNLNMILPIMFMEMLKLVTQ